MAGGLAFDANEFASFKARSAAPSGSDAGKPAPSSSGFDAGEFAAFKSRSAPPRDEPAGGDRFDLGSVTSAGTDASAEPLAQGMRRAADERLVGKPGARNAAMAALYEAGSEAGLNLPGNVAAGIATVAGKHTRDWAPWIERATGLDTRIEGYDPSFSANRQLFDDQRAALARQHPRVALAGDVAGVVGGAVALPPIGKAGTTLAGRTGQAALSGGVYGATAEALDSFDPARAAVAGGIWSQCSALPLPARRPEPEVADRRLRPRRSARHPGMAHGSARGVGRLRFP